MVTVASWGGGVNSTAMILEWLARKEPLHLVLFADTGGEKPETYAYRERFAVLMRKHSVPFYTVIANLKDPTLEAECLRSSSLPSIAYGYKRCSLKWKRGPQDVFCNNWDVAIEAWKRGEKVTKLIGFDAGERRRTFTAPSDHPKYSYRYPLIEWEMGRKECVTRIEQEGLCVPPKSSCFFCPSMKPAEILALRDRHPDLFQRALAIEANAETYAVNGLGRNFKWKALAEQDRRQLKLFAVPTEIPCDCMDEFEEDEED